MLIQSKPSLANNLNPDFFARMDASTRCWLGLLLGQACVLAIDGAGFVQNSLHLLLHMRLREDALWPRFKEGLACQGHAFWRKNENQMSLSLVSLICSGYSGGSLYMATRRNMSSRRRPDYGIGNENSCKGLQAVESIPRSPSSRWRQSYPVVNRQYLRHFASLQRRRNTHSTRTFNPIPQRSLGSGRRGSQ